LDKEKVAIPGTIAYRTAPGDEELIERNLGESLDGSVGRFREGTRFYPTEPTARSLRKGSLSEGRTGETITYYTKTKVRVPILWFASERARKAGLGAPALTIDIKEKDLRRALKEPYKWEMLCPKCKERANLKALLDTGTWDAIDFRELFCPHDGEVQMTLIRAGSTKRSPVLPKKDP